MSITGDIKGYADNAVAEGRKVLDQTLSTAQAQLNDLNGNVQSIADKATGVAKDVRVQAEKAINVDAIRSAVEPYLEQAKSYQVAVQDRAEALFAELRKDPRFAKALEVSGTAVGTVVGTVQGLVKQGQSATQTSTATPARKPAPSRKATSKPASTARKSASTRPAAKKATARKTATKRTTTGTTEA